jgi:hypothetical protein
MVDVMRMTLTLDDAQRPQPSHPDRGMIHFAPSDAALIATKTFLVNK